VCRSKIDASPDTGAAMKTLAATILLTSLAIGGSAVAQNSPCGLKPKPTAACHIDRCVNGAWEEVCDLNPAMSCGLKPVAKLGCRIGRCLRGGWEQVCEQNSQAFCGPKPNPALGCTVGRCVNGAWEQVCGQ